MNTKDTAVEVKDLSKCYRIFSSPRARLLQGLWPGSRQFYRPFWALRGISFTLEKGCTMGIVGRNGSGKSTLLQLLCGTLTPTEGSVRCSGRVAALLELGSGFNPEFTGFENVFLNASLLGLSQRETEERLDDILSFADIGEFINQPIKTYSSGMALRLAFAVQANIEPDILVIDEALAVGDEFFQRKCFTHIQRLRDQGAAILLVTHSCPQILKHCDQAILLDHGCLLLHDSPKEVVTTYQRLSNTLTGQWNLAETASTQPHTTVRYPENGGSIDNLKVIDNAGESIDQSLRGTGFQLRFSYTIDPDAEELDPSHIHFGCNLASHDGLQITGQRWDPTLEEADALIKARRFSIIFSFSGRLIAGTYFISGAMWCGEERRIIHRVIDIGSIKIVEQKISTTIGICDLSSGPPRLILEVKDHDAEDAGTG